MWRTHGILETGTALNRALFPPSLSSQAQQGQYSRPLASDQCSPWFLVPHRDRRQRDRNPGEPEETGRLKVPWSPVGSRSGTLDRAWRTLNELWTLVNVSALAPELE